MKQLEPTTRDHYQFHCDVIASTRFRQNDPEFQNRLNALGAELSTLFIQYAENFATNDLTTTLPRVTTNIEKADLISLYKFDRKLIQELKKEITTTATGRIISTCQNCTINSANTFDHILPKEVYSEFSVNPLNLFPTCSECNSYKNSQWQNAGIPYFLNLYLNNLPTVQYLFVDLNFNGNNVTTNFRLEPHISIAPQLWQIINSHYTRLHLLRRFVSEVDRVIPKLVAQIKASLAHSNLNYTEIQQIVISQINEQKLSYGENFWEAILGLTLINHPDFLAFVNAN
ncbi:HNH endonuclease [Flavobacterium alkalisoli]|uniref:HNH endonuclease n=1 Tax=Flavobacterium alkalisoli TaxID=2602769 RepID=A0A5B9FUV8_9FLAO|nr:HNH endonuclease [Flavobacterium alkalisoli]QEE50694.1 HNH endonuclease [Flavobacterium alkalisoli]